MTLSAPITPLAPARLSTTIGCPSSSVSRGAIVREVMSAGPPAENGTTIRIGLLGKGWAPTLFPASNPAAAHIRASCFFMVSSLPHYKEYRDGVRQFTSSFIL